jgi:uncharacterized phiE125 gp8 family phage protein
MTQIRTVAPAVMAVTLDAAKQALRIDGDHMDALVTTWVKGVIAKMEHAIGQCMMEQTWEVRLPAFPSVRCWDIGNPDSRPLTDAVSLPHPAMEIVSVKYVDQDGNERPLPDTAYRLSRGRYASSLSPARGERWPATGADEAAVIVEVKCGYGNTPEKTPETAQLFILRKLVEQFDPVTRAERDTVQSVYLDGLVNDLKTYS